MTKRKKINDTSVALALAHFAFSLLNIHRIKKGTRKKKRSKSINATAALLREKRIMPREHSVSSINDDDDIMHAHSMSERDS